MTGPFRVVVADPPWKFSDKLPGPGRGAAKHYPCMSVWDLCRFPLPPLADDCHLFLWRVASMPFEPIQVAHAWGFTPKAEIIWIKKTVTGKRWFGMGRTVRMEHETCIVATRGRPSVRVKNIRSTFEAKVGTHSQKPGEFFQLVESLCDGPYCELFARRERQGWSCYGDEIARTA